MMAEKINVSGRFFEVHLNYSDKQYSSYGISYSGDKLFIINLSNDQNTKSELINLINEDNMLFDSSYSIEDILAEEMDRGLKNWIADHYG